MVGEEVGGCVRQLRKVGGSLPAHHDKLLLCDDWAGSDRDDQIPDREQRLQTLDPGQLRLCGKFRLAGGEQPAGYQVQLGDPGGRGEHSHSDSSAPHGEASLQGGKSANISQCVVLGGGVL